jgi:hypothetical protein
LKKGETENIFVAFILSSVSFLSSLSETDLINRIIKKVDFSFGLIIFTGSRKSETRKKQKKNQNKIIFSIYYFGQKKEQCFNKI